MIDAATIVNSIRLAPVAPTNAKLREWYHKLVTTERYNPFGYAGETPHYWIGLWSAERLLSAYGFIGKDDGTLACPAAVCEPSKPGLAALQTLGILLKKAFANRRLLFVVATENKRMRRIVDTVLEARTIAEVKELP